MSHSPEQMRKKAEAMNEARHHHMHATVDGSKGRPQHAMHSHMAHMGDGGMMKEREMGGE